jgi:hypothetical protein
MTKQSLENQQSTEPKVDSKVNHLTTGGGKIRCLRCNALSKRTGFQCGRPASKGSKTQKCHMHGGRGNSAPKTDEGRQRVTAAHTKSGEFTNAAKLEQSKSSARLAQLEDAMHVLGMTTAVRTRGRKSNLYVPLTTIDDVRAMLVDEILHKDRGSNGH